MMMMDGQSDAHHRSLPVMPSPTVWLVTHPTLLDESASRSLRRQQAITQTTISCIRIPCHCLTPRRSSASGVFTTARTLVVSPITSFPPPPPSLSFTPTSLRRLPNWPPPAQSPPKRAARSFRRKDPLCYHGSGKALLCTCRLLSVLLRLMISSLFLFALLGR